MPFLVNYSYLNTQTTQLISLIVFFLEDRIFKDIKLSVLISFVSHDDHESLN